MKHKIQFGKAYLNEAGKRVCDVKIDEEIVESVKAVQLNERKCQKCRHNCDCEYIARTLDCQKNANALANVFNFFTGIILVAAIYWLFCIAKLNFWVSVGYLIFCFLGMDILCTCIEEEIVPKLYEWLGYKKVKRHIARKEKRNKVVLKKEAKLKRKEKKVQSIMSPYYQEVIAARNVVERFKNLSQQQHYGSSGTKIEVCVEYCEAILQKIHEKSSRYTRVRFLFEEYLPQCCNMLEMYTNFVKSNTLTSKHINELTATIDTLFKYLDTQLETDHFRNELESEENQFHSTAQNLKETLQKEMNKEASKK